jgi:DNA-binding NarL/FixJ family response regulator
MIRVAIADDQALVRAGFLTLLDQPDLTVVGQADNGEEAHRLAVRAQPDVLLMDIRMHGVDGIEATRRIVADPACPHTRIIMLTTYELDDYVFDSLVAGASGFLTKDVDPDELGAAIRTVATGNALLTPSVTRRVIDSFTTGATRRPDTSRLDTLTPREREVLILVGEGLSNDEIGHRLHMSRFTAKTHVGRLFAKLGARDRVQLVIIAYQTGAVT